MKDRIKRRIKQAVICFLILGGIILGNIPDEAFAELPDTDFYSGKIVVKTEDLTNLPEGGEILTENNGMYLVDYVSPSEAEKAYLAMELNPDILASPEASFVVCQDSDVQKNVPKETEDALSFIEDEVPDYSKENVIAIIDTGAKPSDVMATFSVLSDSGKDENGHGSKMVEAIKSVDNEAKIVSIKALNKNGAGSISSVYSAIKLAIKMKVKVINLSIVAKSVDENEIIKDVIWEALNQNIIVVGAAGNSGDEVNKFIPGCINGVIIAGACDELGNRLSTSNYGEGVDWNVLADSTSEASAKLSGFISKNCNNDKTLGTKIAEEVGKGLVFSVDGKENADSITPSKEFSNIKWKDISPESLSQAEIDFFSKGSELNSIKLSEDGEYLMVTTTDYAVPDDGSFVPAAWNYARVTSQTMLRMNGTTGSNGIYDDRNPTTVVSNADGTVSQTSNLMGGYDYRMIGFTFNYEPGSFEKSPQVSRLGTETISSQSMIVHSKWSDGLWDKEVSSGVKTFNADKLSGLVQLSFYPVENTCIPYLYKSHIKLYLKNLEFNKKPVRNTYSTDSHSIWYEEGGIGSAKKAEISTDYALPYHAEVGLALRKYKVYYQKSGNANDLYFAGTGIVGSPFNFSAAEKIANQNMANKSLGWNYQSFGSETRPSDSFEIIPFKTTSVETGEDGEVFYKYVVTPSGNNKSGKVKLSVAAKENLAKVAGAKFKLISQNTTVREDLITNKNGEIIIENLLWRESWDSEHDSNYVLVPVSVPAGYLLPREVPFEIQKEDVYSDRIPEFQRLLDIEEKSISLESVVRQEDSPQNVFTYSITGEDVSGKQHSFLCISNERYERKVPAGRYKVTVTGKNGYKRLDTEYLEGFEVNDITNLVNNQRGSIRFIWEYNELEGGSSGDVCINRFRK